MAEEPGKLCRNTGLVSMGSVINIDFCFNLVYIIFAFFDIFRGFSYGNRFCPSHFSHTVKPQNTCSKSNLMTTGV